MLPSPSELHYFIEVSQTLNVSRAAERLGVSQPTLSLAIRRLEHGVGAPLFIRSKSGVRLTRAGQRLAGQARFLVAEWERLQGDAVRGETELRGQYVVGCHPSVALNVGPELMPKLLAANPHLEIQLEHDLSRKITEDVISFKVDFGIVVNPSRHPDLVIQPIGKDVVTLWTTKKPSPLQDLDGSGVLICDPDLSQSQTLLRQLTRRGLKFQRTVTSSNLEVICSLVAAKAGVGILPGRVASRTPGNKLVSLPKAPTFNDQHCLIYRADAQRSAAAKSLARSLVELCRFT